MCNGCVKMTVVEAEVQQQIRLASMHHGAPLLRNNSGACVDETGRLIRYGLGNDSKKINEVFKSSDLIGIWPLIITPEHVGMRLGIFHAVEVKHSGWRKPSNKRERAQQNFGDWVRSHGGLFQFATSVEDIWPNG
jgi:hypothetical protein